MIAFGGRGVMGLRERKRSFEQPDRAIHIVFRMQEEAHPTRVRKDVVRLGFMRGDDFVAHALGKRDVHQAVAVNVPDLAPAEAKFHAAKSVRRHLNALPLACGCANPAIGS